MANVRTSERVAERKAVTGAGPAVEVLSGAAAGRVYALGAQTTIGRGSGCAIVLEGDREVSRQHAEIRCEGGRYRIQDLGSANGMRVDASLVREAWLGEGQHVTIGRTELVFRVPNLDVPQEERLALLESCQLLKALPAEDKRALAGQLIVRFHPAGAMVLSQGRPIESMLFLQHGRVRVVVINDEGAERLLARLGPGASYGERMLVAGGKLGESLIADADCVILELPKERFDALLAKRPAAGETVHLVIADRLRSAQAQAASVAAVEGDAEDRARRSDGLQNLVTSTDVEIVGEDPKIVQVRKRIEGWAKEDGALLICGPQGSGKKTVRPLLPQGEPAGAAALRRAVAGGPGAGTPHGDPLRRGDRRGVLGPWSARLSRADGRRHSRLSSTPSAWTPTSR